MKVLHISAECYPAAKAGGLGDVAGALPKYLNQIDISTAVVIPKYQTKWLNQQEYREVYRDTARLHNGEVPFVVEEVTSADLGFQLFVVNMPGKFDRTGIYNDDSGKGYGDSLERAISFQNAVLLWVRQFQYKPKVLHCHDHHTGLIPFMVKYCPEYESLANIPTVFTIHNGAYHGAFSWENQHLLPFYYASARGLLDWGNTINPLASGIRNSWAVTTVSPSYMDELRRDSNGLETLVQSESHKSVGIINGIDPTVWNPSTDKFIAQRLAGDDVAGFKKANKEVLLQRFRINPDLPLITFIGRLAREKGADLLPDMIRKFLHYGHKAAFVILGTGDQALHQEFEHMRHHLHGHFDAALTYDEGLAHQLYAGSDFLIMPSRVEPCGLNQMYCMSYGTVPIVRSIGGLIDTVPDIGEPDGSGRGIRFDNFNLDDAFTACYRATEVYRNKTYLEDLRKRIMQVDFSWTRSAQTYADVYRHFVPNL
ncbi:MAG: glycogen synthase [Saprospiraceae bacterium]